MVRKRERLIEARKTAGLTQEDLAHELQVAVSTVKRWESGRTTPTAWTWRRIATVLRVDRCELVEMFKAPPTLELSPSLHGQAPNDDVDWTQLGTLCHRPSRLNATALESLEQITARQRTLYHELSSTEMLAHVEAHLALLETLLAHAQPDRIHRRLAGAAGEAAGFAAWLWFDLGHPQRARDCYLRSRYSVAESGDAGLGAYVQGYRGTVAGQEGDLGAALGLLNEATRIAPESLSGLTRSWLEIQRADALAGVGRTAAALAAIDTARELHSRGRSAGADPWMYDFDTGSFAEHTGTCYLRLGQACRAAEEFERALHHQAPGHESRGARIRVGLAHARLASGDRTEALRLAGEALDVFARRGSVSGLREVADVREAFRQRGLDRAVDELDARARVLAGRR